MDHNQSQQPNLTGAILIVTFVLVAAILANNANLNFALQEASDAQGLSEGETVALVLPTETPQPTQTPVPATPVPTLTPTLQSTSTPVPTDTPQPEATAILGDESSGGGQTVTSGGTNYDPALVERGSQLFTGCAACHGADGQGVPNLGKDLVHSEFIHGLSDTELTQFIITGRPIWDPLNTTGLDMPSKGGNPTLSSEDIMAIVAYIRTLSEE